MTQPSLPQFAERLIAAGLLSEEDLRPFVEAVHADAPSDVASDASADVPSRSSKVLADLLIESERLTHFQAQMLLAEHPGPVSLDEYELLEKLGEGGMGAVYKARHRHMDRIVALKVLSDKSVDTPQALQRFQREVRASARLRHPHIVTAHDAGNDNGRHYLVMEYVPGIDLNAMVKRRGPLPVEQAVEFILQAAIGLEYAHQKGVVHRDIKPANLILDDEDGTIKILDMGLARLFDVESSASEQDLTNTHTVMGTAAYMAPEQAIKMRTSDGRADQYALGCTLYYLLSGKHPYRGENFLEVIILHREGEIPSLRGVAPDASPALDTVFRKMLAKKPDDRYPSMRECIAALQMCPLRGDFPANFDPSANWADPALWTGAHGMPFPPGEATQVSSGNPATGHNPPTPNTGRVPPVRRGGQTGALWQERTELSSAAPQSAASHDPALTQTSHQLGLGNTADLGSVPSQWADLPTSSQVTPFSKPLTAPTPPLTPSGPVSLPSGVWPGAELISVPAPTSNAAALWTLGLGSAGLALTPWLGPAVCSGLVIIWPLAIAALVCAYYSARVTSRGGPHGRKATVGIVLGIGALLGSSFLQCSGLLTLVQDGVWNTVKKFEEKANRGARWNEFATLWHTPGPEASAAQLFPLEVAGYHRSRVDEKAAIPELGIHREGVCGTYELGPATAFSTSPKIHVRVGAFQMSKSEWLALRMEVARYVSQSHSFHTSSGIPDLNQTDGSELGPNYVINDREIYFANFNVTGTGDEGYFWFSEGRLFVAHAVNNPDLDHFFSSYLHAINPSTKQH